MQRVLRVLKCPLVGNLTLSKFTRGLHTQRSISCINQTNPCWPNHWTPFHNATFQLTSLQLHHHNRQSTLVRFFATDRISSSGTRGARRILAARRKQIKKKKFYQRTNDESHEGGRCAAYATADAYNLASLQGFLQRHRFVPSAYSNVVHISYSHDISKQLEMPGEKLTPATDLYRFPSQDSSDDPDTPYRMAKDVFFFGDGCLVCWGTTQEEEREWRRLLRSTTKTQVNPIDDLKQPSEIMDVYRSDVPGMYNDCVIVREDVEDLSTQLLAFSFGLARSIKLDVLEGRAEAAISRMRHLPMDIRAGSLPSTRQSRQMVGEQLQLRAMLNLYTELVETPELYWEEPEYTCTCTCTQSLNPKKLGPNNPCSFEI